LVLAPLVGLAILVPLALDALVFTADVFAAAVSVALAFDAFAALADVVPVTVFVFVARPGRCTVGQPSESDQTERATGGGLEHATTTGLRSQDAGDGIKPIRVQDFLLCA
jgi:curli biogenesis system outer membrane secretion channel CsgG